MNCTGLTEWLVQLYVTSFPIYIVSPVDKTNAGLGKMPAGESTQGQVRYEVGAFGDTAGLRQFREAHRPAQQPGRREQPAQGPG